MRSARGPRARDRAAAGGRRVDSLDLSAGRGTVLLVGHEPDLSDEIARLTGARVKLRKGGVAILEPSLLRPEDSRRIAGGG